MQSYVGETLYDRHGEPIGEVTDVILDPRTLEPDLVTVKPGWLRAEHVVPASIVHEHEGRLQTSRTAEVVKHGPKCREHRSPTPGERDEIDRHYGITPVEAGTAGHAG